MKLHAVNKDFEMDATQYKRLRTRLEAMTILLWVVLLFSGLNFAWCAWTEYRVRRMADGIRESVDGILDETRRSAESLRARRDSSP